MSDINNSGNENKAGSDGRISIDQAIRLAMELQKQSKLDQAEGIYGEVLSVFPEHPDALHFLGILHYQRGHTAKAIQIITRALDASPDYVDAHNNLGNIYMEQGRLEEAEACYRRTVELAPGHLGAGNNLGTVLRALGRLDEAEPVFRNALAMSSDFFPLHYNLGNLLYQQGRAAEAVDQFFQALVLDPEQAGSKVMLGIALMTVGRQEEAVVHFRQWLKEDPGNPEALHLLAACSGEAVPDRASDEYVKCLFDRFADSFEESLNQLAYQAPELVVGAMAKACIRPDGDLDILDAGCGTGLCGALLKPYARRLDGVDLSAGMLKRAAKTGNYDRLEEAELTAFISDRKDVYDVIVCADTLCYFGDLQKVLRGVAGALKPGGNFIFTVERKDEAAEGIAGSYLIKPQGRYAHSETYLRQVARLSGLEPRAVSYAVLRQEMGRPVNGLVVTLAPA
ncbi:tetratricopeptide repeat protein [uncultured Desulfosarcina sp.]|uniref:tetratricopeptide repeat protein n=1 Tax=uncultured Desulfosarcina sp. TaxID=218289 RepID=UPI0029C8F3E3|nr:tetratricopeptide repeat protein [uncultured Desulfosarcina sp.]